MIKDTRVGNILDQKNATDIIIGMNVDFEDVRGIGLPFVSRIRKTRAITLGTVVTFEYDSTRQLHMLVCHRLGAGGWDKADQYVRYGMDYLWKLAPERQYSIVKIGAGRIGSRDGADRALIHSAMASSFLPVELFVLDERERIPAEVRPGATPMKPLWIWDMEQGKVPVHLNG